MRFTVLFLNAVTSRLSVGVSFGCGAGFSTGTIDAIFLLLFFFYRSINTTTKKRCLEMFLFFFCWLL